MKGEQIVCRTFAASEVLPLLDGPVEKVLVAVDALAADQLLHQPEDVELLGSLGELEVDLERGGVLLRPQRAVAGRRPDQPALDARPRAPSLGARPGRPEPQARRLRGARRAHLALRTHLPDRDA